MRSDIAFWWWSYSQQGLRFSLVESCRVLWVVNHIAEYDWRGNGIGMASIDWSEMFHVVCAVGDEVLAGDQTFQYFNSEDMKTLQDDSVGSTAKVSEWSDWHTVNILKVTHKGTTRIASMRPARHHYCDHLFNNCLKNSIIVTVSLQSDYTLGLLSPFGASDMLFYADLSYSDRHHYCKVVMLYHHSHAVNNSFILSLLDYRLSRLFANFS